MVARRAQATRKLKKLRSRNKAAPAKAGPRAAKIRTRSRVRINAPMAFKPRWYNRHQGPIIYDMPRVGLVHHRIGKHNVQKFTWPLLSGVHDYSKSERFRAISQRWWSRHKDAQFSRQDQLWQALGRLWRSAKLPYLRKGGVRRRQVGRRRVWTKNAASRFVGLAHVIHSIKKWGRLARPARNPVLAAFAQYKAYLSRFFSKPSRQPFTRAKNFVYWRAGWFANFGRIADRDEINTNNRLVSGRGGLVLRGLALAPRFKASALWADKWWWAKVRLLLTKPALSINIVQPDVATAQYRLLAHGRTLASEVAYKKRRKIVALLGRASSMVAGYGARLLNDINKGANKALQPISFEHRLSDVKRKSLRVIRSINFAHSLMWVTPFLNAFVRKGQRQAIEAQMRRALVFLRLYLNWIFDFFGQAAVIIDKGRPIFRFVVFERKMKKRKRKTWTVPKLLFKERGYVWGARMLWTALSSAEGLKLVDRFVLMMEELSDGSLLKEFTSGRYTQTRRASKLRRWMRFLRRKRRRIKLKSILTIKSWWRYAWRTSTNFYWARRGGWFKQSSLAR